MRTGAGFSVPDELSREIPRIGLHAVQLYLILGRAGCLGEYPSPAEIAEEMGKKKHYVWQLVEVLAERKFLNTADIGRLMELDDETGDETEVCN